MKTKTIIFLVILLFSKLYAENQRTSLHFDGKEGEVINAISDGIITDLGFDEERGMFVTVNYEELGMSACQKGGKDCYNRYDRKCCRCWRKLIN